MHLVHVNKLIFLNYLTSVRYIARISISNECTCANKSNKNLIKAVLYNFLE